nr:hypothetical protein CFP56_13838 [Quercus suber]POE67693.1 hypothetical protein CFP56_13841 [Quercus suber]
MDELKEIDEDAHNWLQVYSTTIWARHMFNEDGLIDTVLDNMCESFNSKILKFRSKPIINMIQKRFQHQPANRTSSTKLSHTICIISVQHAQLQSKCTTSAMDKLFQSICNMLDRHAQLIQSKCTIPVHHAQLHSKCTTSVMDELFQAICTIPDQQSQLIQPKCTIPVHHA